MSYPDPNSKLQAPSAAEPSSAEPNAAERSASGSSVSPAGSVPSVQSGWTLGPWQGYGGYDAYSAYSPYRAPFYGAYPYPVAYQPYEAYFSPYWQQPFGAAGFPYPALRQPVLPHASGPERPEERPPHAEHIDWSTRYPGEIILRGPNKREVALTFDDGPDDEFTPRVLDQLHKLGVKGTFFVVGQRAERNPEVLKRIVREGHVVGSHTWNHPNLTKLTREEIRSQLERTDETIHSITGKTPRLFRPPYGALNDDVVKEAIRLKKKIIFWNVDSLDWMQLNARQVAANILSHARPGSIILQHSAGGIGEDLTGTIEALPLVVDALRKRNYKFRTVPQLVGIPAQ